MKDSEQIEEYIDQFVELWLSEFRLSADEFFSRHKEKFAHSLELQIEFQQELRLIEEKYVEKWAFIEQSGKYQFRDIIGKGGMGAVYKAYDRWTGREVAIKVLRKDKNAKIYQSNPKDTTERFNREIENHGRLTKNPHQNIVQVFTVEAMNDNERMLVMELIEEGKSLAQFVEEDGKKTLEEALDIVYQIARGLQHLYNGNIVHRDITSNNIIIDKNGTPKILDMGLAVSLSQNNGEGRQTKLGEKIYTGSDGFRSPEQAKCERELDCRTDIYGLGATFFHILTGIHPAHREDHEEPDCPLSFRNCDVEIEEAAEPFLQKMCARARKHRYQTPQELLNAIDEYSTSDFGLITEFIRVLREGTALAVRALLAHPLCIKKNLNVRTLINDPNSHDVYMMPLHWAAAHNPNKGVVQCLIDLGAKIDEVDSVGRTPLHCAAQFNPNVDVVSYLISLVRDINTPSANRATPLHLAAYSNPNVDVLKCLIDHNADVNAKDIDINSPLHVAVRHNSNVDVVRYLVDHKADFFAINKDKETPLHVAAQHNSNVEVIRYLVSLDAGFADIGADGETPLHLAARYNHSVDVVAFLVSKSTSVDVKNNYNSTPLLLAVSDNTNDAVPKYLVSQEADVNTYNDFGDRLTALHVAILNRRDMEIAMCLISSGARVTDADQAGNTSLHHAVSAVYNSNVAAIEYLISKDADVNAVNRAGGTLLHATAQYNPKADVLQCLISHGLDINARDNADWTPLHYAVTHHPRIEVVRLFVSLDANVDERNVEGKTVLHYTAERNTSPDVFDYLLAQSKDINVQDKTGKTPLHFAVLNSNIAFLRCALARGADVNAQDNENRTPLDYAESPDKIEILRSAGGKSGLELPRRPPQTVTDIPGELPDYNRGSYWQ